MYIANKMTRNKYYVHKIKFIIYKNNTEMLEFSIFFRKIHLEIMYKQTVTIL